MWWYIIITLAIATIVYCRKNCEFHGSWKQLDKSIHWKDKNKSK